MLHLTCKDNQYCIAHQIQVLAVVHRPALWANENFKLQLKLNIDKFFVHHLQKYLEGQCESRHGLDCLSVAHTPTSAVKSRLC